MPRLRPRLPQFGDRLFLAYTGLETDLMFKQGVDLPGFATYPLLDDADGRARLVRSCRELVAVARAFRAGVVLESATWVAHRDRGAALGHGPERLRDANIRAIALIDEVRSENADVPIVLSANVGPRGDAYAPGEASGAEEAESYHAEQVSALAETAVEVISGYTFAAPAEAIGLVRAARRFDLPAVVAFTVETDGRLPSGLPLSDAVAETDEATGGYASGFMINCAHPDHVAQALSDAPPLARVRGVVANASRLSHAELDAAETLDEGDPAELGRGLAALRRRFPQLSVLGGCCGTDMRHMTEIAKAASRR